MAREMKAVSESLAFKSTYHKLYKMLLLATSNKKTVAVPLPIDDEWNFSLRCHLVFFDGLDGWFINYCDLLVAEKRTRTRKLSIKFRDRKTPSRNKVYLLLGILQPNT